MMLTYTDPKYPQCINNAVALLDSIIEMQASGLAPYRDALKGHHPERKVASKPHKDRRPSELHCDVQLRRDVFRLR